jgi:hypothetical protein
MPHPAYGPKNRDRVKHLLGVLLSYADDELEGIEQLRSNLKVNWQTEKQLVVRTKLRTLEELTEKDEQPGKLTKEQIREAINHLKNYLKILIDNRESSRGSENWHFTLDLWSKDKEENLRRFDAEWQAKLPPKSKLLSFTSREPRDVPVAPETDEASTVERLGYDSEIYLDQVKTMPHNFGGISQNVSGSQVNGGMQAAIGDNNQQTIEAHKAAPTKKRKCQN